MVSSPYARVRSDACSYFSKLAAVLTMLSQLKCLTGLTVVMVLSGCGSTFTSDYFTESASSPQPTELSAVRRWPVPEARSLASNESVEFVEPAGPLTLRQALSLVLLRSPELVTTSYEIRAAEARRLQAKLIPNPEVELGINEFGGTGSRSGSGAAETTLSLSQTIELGGKRQLRTRVADRDRDLANWTYEAKRLDVLLAATQTFIDVIAAQKAVVLAEDATGISQRVIDSVSERVKAGRIAQLEETRARVVLSTNQLALERARRELRTSREQLAAMWGSTTPVFTEAQGDYEALQEIPQLEQLVEQASGNPDLARWGTEIEQREQSLKLEKAKNIPDPKVSIGMTRFEDTDESAFLVGISVPIPLFGINPGGIREAEVALAQSAAERREAEIRVATALSSAYQLLASSYSEVAALQRQVLPAAEQAFSVAREGYQVGKFTFLELLDAQRALLESRGSYIDALSNYHKSLAEVERLTGQPLKPAAQ